MNQQPPRSYRQRIAAKTRHLRDVLDAIDERAARADASTVAPARRPTFRVQNSGYADPTSLTVGERDDVLGQVEADLWQITEQAHRAVGRLGAWAPNADPDDRCQCPEQCCPDGCTKPRIDGRDEHPTCRARRSRARRRGETWALDEPA